ncbi:MAG: homocysteine S-methyltransferase family protein [Bacteroidales bacterium]|nr:homocysteine S-methyltransferase family protein [Bacteroidales bacterium]
MKTKLSERLKKGEIIISDGALGTMLQAAGLEPGTCPELWNIEFPDRVEAIARAYAEAGSEAVETNTFGANRFKLSHYGLQDRVAELNTRAVEIVRKAIGPDRIVLGSVGPTGVLLMMGEVSEDDLYEAFREQCVALAEAGADVICIETMTALDEAVLAIKAAKWNTHLEVICTMTFDKTIQGDFRTMMGISPTEMTHAFKAAGADIVGTNCGNGMENMIAIVEEIRLADPGIPILVHGNAGKPHYHDGQNIFDETPEITASFVPNLIRAGATCIGGCCGTTPDHIRKIREVTSGK